MDQNEELLQAAAEDPGSDRALNALQPWKDRLADAPHPEAVARILDAWARKMVASVRGENERRDVDDVPAAVAWVGSMLQEWRPRADGKGTSPAAYISYHRRRLGAELPDDDMANEAGARKVRAVAWRIIGELGTHPPREELSSLVREHIIAERAAAKGQDPADPQVRKAALVAMRKAGESRAILHASDLVSGTISYAEAYGHDDDDGTPEERIRAGEADPVDVSETLEHLTDGLGRPEAARTLCAPHVQHILRQMA